MKNHRIESLGLAAAALFAPSAVLSDPLLIVGEAQSVVSRFLDLGARKLSFNV